MKKLLSIALLATLAFTTIACGPPASTSKKVESTEVKTATEKK